jgi:hypothetical protein
MIRPLLGDKVEEFAELMELQKSSTIRFVELLRGWKYICGGSGPVKVPVDCG